MLGQMSQSVPLREEGGKTNCNCQQRISHLSCLVVDSRWDRLAWILIVCCLVVRVAAQNGVRAGSSAVDSLKSAKIDPELQGAMMGRPPRRARGSFPASTQARYNVSTIRQSDNPTISLPLDRFCPIPSIREASMASSPASPTPYWQHAKLAPLF